MDIILLAFFTGRWKPWNQFADVDTKYIVAVILATGEANPAASECYLKIENPLQHQWQK